MEIRSKSDFRSDQQLEEPYKVYTPVTLVPFGIDPKIYEITVKRVSTQIEFAERRRDKYLLDIAVVLL